MRRSRLFSLLAAVILGALPTAEIVGAQSYPSRPITLISPWPAGGAIDGLCRILAIPLGERLGQPVVIENRPGAASMIGTLAGARATPDGYTLVMAGSNSLAIAATVYKKLPYDPTSDLAPIGLAARIPFALVVHPSVPVKSVADLVKLAKEKPGQLNYASGGPGSVHHLFMELLQSMTGIDMRHVPYKGSAPAITDLVAGHVQVLMSDSLAAIPQIRAGHVRVLGVSTSSRWPNEPDIPTIAEAGVPGYEASGWGMIAAPAGTSREIIMRLHAEMKKIEGQPEVHAQLIKLGMLPVVSDAPDALKAFITAETERYAPIVRKAGLAGTL